jgi:hypothetical protein
MLIALFPPFVAYVVIIRIFVPKNLKVTDTPADILTIALPPLKLALGAKHQYPLYSKFKSLLSILCHPDSGEVNGLPILAIHCPPFFYKFK